MIQATDTSAMPLPTREGVLAAARAIAAILSPTPLLLVEIGGVQAWVKCENL
jgi:threonine dehydratase